VFRRSRELRWSDEDDLLQEVQLAWWRQRRAYDKGRGASPETFLKRVVRHVLEDIAKAEAAQSRAGAHEAMSLDAPLEAESSDDDGGLSGYDLIGSGDDLREVDFTLDLDAVLGRLTPRQRAVIGGLRDGHDKAALARLLAIHRDTVYQDLTQIRSVFREAKLL